MQLKNKDEGWCWSCAKLFSCKNRFYIFDGTCGMWKEKKKNE